MFHYWGFGLTIVSEIEFPELLPYKALKYDLEIKLGKVPSFPQELSFDGNFTSGKIEDQAFWYRVKEVAAYYVVNGNSITVEVDNPVIEMRSVRLYILASVMAALLLQRKLLPFHASAILLKDSLCLIAGDSGAGKSTTVAGLIKKGYAIFTDDLVVLSRNENSIKAFASYPMLKLWDDSITQLNYSLFKKRDFHIRNGIDKFGIFFHENFNCNSYPVSQIIFLKKSKSNQFTCNEIKGATIFTELMNQIYRPLLAEKADIKEPLFHLFSHLTQFVKTYIIERPEFCHPDELLHIVESIL